jgi:hypothetical protein
VTQNTQTCKERLNYVVASLWRNNTSISVNSYSTLTRQPSGPDDEGSGNLWNVAMFLQAYRHIIPQGCHHTHRRENLKSHIIQLFQKGKLLLVCAAFFEDDNFNNCLRSTYTTNEKCTCDFDGIHSSATRKTVCLQIVLIQMNTANTDLHPCMCSQRLTCPQQTTWASCVHNQFTNNTTKTSVKLFSFNFKDWL